MVSNRCKMAVREELKKLDLHFTPVELGEVEVMENITMEQREQIKAGLLLSGLELMDDKKAMLIEKIKRTLQIIYFLVFLSFKTSTTSFN